MKIVSQHFCHLLIIEIKVVNSQYTKILLTNKYIDNFITIQRKFGVFKHVTC